jgi:P27 family predicted phage terminase small subunit
LESFDRCNEAREILANEGLTYITPHSGVPHQHPALMIEKEAKAQCMKLFKQLGLDSELRWAEMTIYDKFSME